MEVTKTTWAESIQEILENIRTADFIAIDTNAEVTGFIMADESLNLRTLEGEEWYNVLLSKQRTRSPLEFGIAMFKEDLQSGSINVKSYNIPILMAYVEEHDARQDVRDAKGLEERLDIDAIGLEFIQKINFDLNKSLYDGVPFLNKERGLEAKDYMEKHPNFMMIEGKHVTNGDLDRAYFPELIEKLEHADIEDIVERLRGIGKFLDVTAEVKVPVIGHNLFIKLLLLYKDFVEFLPTRYSELIPKLEVLLPEFYDTKYVSWEIGINQKASDKERLFTYNSKLYQLYRNTISIGKSSHAPNFRLHEASKVYEVDLEELYSENLEGDPTSFCYECGFDAVLAGMVFCRLAVLSFDDFKVKAFPEYAKRWKNKPFIQKDLQDVLFDHEKPNKLEPLRGHSSRSVHHTWANFVQK